MDRLEVERPRSALRGLCSVRSLSLVGSVSRWLPLLVCCLLLVLTSVDRLSFSSLLVMAGGAAAALVVLLQANRASRYFLCDARWLSFPLLHSSTPSAALLLPSTSCTSSPSPRCCCSQWHACKQARTSSRRRTTVRRGRGQQKPGDGPAHRLKTTVALDAHDIDDCCV